MGFEKVLVAVKVIKDGIQYRSQSLLNLARGYFSYHFILECYSLFSGVKFCLKSFCFICSILS